MSHSRDAHIFGYVPINNEKNDSVAKGLIITIITRKNYSYLVFKTINHYLDGLYAKILQLATYL